MLAQRIENDHVTHQLGDPATRVVGGLGHVATLVVWTQLLSTRRLTLEMTTTVPADLVPANQPFFKAGQVVTVEDVTRLMLTTMAPNVALLMCQLVRERTHRKMSQWYRDLPDYATLAPALANQTGRIRQSVVQSYTGEQLRLLGRLIQDLPREIQDLYHPTETVVNGQIVHAGTQLVARGRLRGGVFFGPHRGSAIAFDHRALYLVLDAPSGYDRDVLLSQLLSGDETALLAGESRYPVQTLTLSRPAPVINLMGDVYAGEFYTDRRRRKHEWDPLTERGYDYAFDRLRPALGAADLNIFNLESALVADRAASRQWQLKTFVLGSDPQPTLAAYQRAHLGVALLANNHGMDYDRPGLRQTLANLQHVGLPAVGAGNLDQATNPLRIQTPAGTISLFNAIWYYDRIYRRFDGYPLADEAGVAPLMGVFFAKIRHERQAHPDHLIVVSPHWGGDFQAVTDRQRQLARRLIAAGADVIAGHGAHAFQTIEEIDGHPVLYGLGNAAFNSNGEYATYPQALPYGGVLQLSPTATGWQLTLRAVTSNNLQTHFQPDWVTSDQFGELLTGLQAQDADLTAWQVDTHQATLKRTYQRP